MPQILVVDDNPDILEALELLLSLHGHTVLTAENEKQALLAVSHQRVDLVIQDMNFALEAGDGLGVIGPSAAGKSSLARLLVGVWQPVRGSVRLDGAALEQWKPESLGAHIAIFRRR